MSLLGRILVSVILRLPLPVFRDSFYVLDLTVVWLLVNCCPFGVVFKVLSSSPAIALGPMRAFVSVDLIVRGGALAASVPPPGRALLSAILSSADSCVWLLVAEETREFGSRVIFGNFLAAAIDGLAVGSKAWIAAEAMRSISSRDTSSCISRISHGSESGQ